MKKGEDTIFYKDVESNYKFTLECYLYIDMFEFIMKNISKVKTEIHKEELVVPPLLTILGIEALSTQKNTSTTT